MTLVHLQLTDKDNVDIVNTWFSEHPSVTIFDIDVSGLDVYIFYE
jgi:hypothetical protein